MWRMLGENRYKSTLCGAVATCPQQRYPTTIQEFLFTTPAPCSLHRAFTRLMPSCHYIFNSCACNILLVYSLRANKYLREKLFYVQ